MNFVYDVDLIGAFSRCVTHDFTQFADVLNAVVGRTIDLQHVHARASYDTLTGFTCITRIRALSIRTVERFSQNARSRSLTDSTRSAQ